MYRKLAKYYDIMFNNKDYANESKHLCDIIGIKRETLLDVGCGTGGHLVHLRQHYRCKGEDVSSDLIEIAKGKGLDVSLSDMCGRVVDDEKYDAIICMHATIAYAWDLHIAITNMVQRLSDGGVVIIEPWYSREQATVGRYDVSVRRDAGVEVIRISKGEIEGDRHVRSFKYFVNDANGAVSHSDIHSMELFDKDKMWRIMNNAGLSMAYQKPSHLFSRGLMVGFKHN